MYTVIEITEKLQTIFRAAPIERAVLFGSYAKGEAKEKSDVDILIDSNGRLEGLDFFGVLEDVVQALNVPVDLIEASQLVDGGRAQREIKETGIVIYEKA